MSELEKEKVELKKAEKHSLGEAKGGKPKITTQQFHLLYKQYYYCLGVSFSSAPSGFNNSGKHQEAYKNMIKNKILFEQRQYYNRCKEAQKYLIEIHSETTFHLSAFLNDKGYGNDLSGLNLSDMNFAGVYFGNINLENTNMSSCAFLRDRDTSSSYCKFLKANFGNAIFKDTIFKGAKIKFTRGHADSRFATHTQIGIPEGMLAEGRIIINSDQATEKLLKEYRPKTSSGDMTKFMEPGFGGRS